MKKKNRHKSPGKNIQGFSFRKLNTNTVSKPKSHNWKSIMLTGVATVTLLAPTVISGVPFVQQSLVALAKTVSDQTKNSIELDPVTERTALQDEAKYGTSNGVKITQNPTQVTQAPSTPQSNSEISTIQTNLIKSYTDQTTSLTGLVNQTIAYHKLVAQLNDYEAQAKAKGWDQADAIKGDLQMQSVADSTSSNIQSATDKAQASVDAWKQFLDAISSGSTTNAGSLVLQNVNSTGQNAAQDGKPIFSTTDANPTVYTDSQWVEIPGVNYSGIVGGGTVSSALQGSLKALGAYGNNSVQDQRIVSVGDTITLQNAIKIQNVKTGEIQTKDLQIKLNSATLEADAAGNGQYVITFNPNQPGLGFGLIAVSGGVSGGTVGGETGGGTGGGGGGSGTGVTYIKSFQLGFTIVGAPSDLTQAVTISDIDAAQQVATNGFDAKGYLVSPNSNLNSSFYNRNTGDVNEGGDSLNPNSFVEVGKGNSINVSYTDNDPINVSIFGGIYGSSAGVQYKPLIPPAIELPDFQFDYNLFQVFVNPNEQPAKADDNLLGDDINGKQTLAGTVNDWKLLWDTSIYKGITTNADIEKGMFFVDAYPSDKVTPTNIYNKNTNSSLPVTKIVDSTGKDVTNELTEVNYQNVSDAPQAVQDMIKKYNLKIQGSFEVWMPKDQSAEGLQAFYDKYYKTGNSLTIHFLTRVNDNVSDITYDNTAMQVDFGNGYITETVGNKTPKIETTKEVQDQNSADKNGQELKIGEFAKYVLHSPATPATQDGMGEPLYNISGYDALDPTYDKYTGQFQIIAATDIATKNNYDNSQNTIWGDLKNSGKIDNNKIPKGTDISKYVDVEYGNYTLAKDKVFVHDVKDTTGKTWKTGETVPKGTTITDVFHWQFKNEFLDVLDPTSAFKYDVQIQFQRIADTSALPDSWLNNVGTFIYNDSEYDTNNVRTKTPKPSTPSNPGTTNQKVNQPQTKLPSTGEDNNPYLLGTGVFMATALAGLAFWKKQELLTAYRRFRRLHF